MEVGFEQFIYLANSELAHRLRRKYMMRVRPKCAITGGLFHGSVQ